MSSSSDDPPNENPQNPVSEITQGNNDHQDAKVETEKEVSPTSVFVNSEPVREEQVQNAVRFLSHPKVRGSPVLYRRSFLERKGLTKEEIDEAFRRVPDSAPAVTTTQPVVANQVQQQPPVQVKQSAPVGPVGSTSRMGTLSRFRWYHGVLAVSLLTASGAVAAVFFKRLVVPKLKSWICWIVLEESGKGLVKKNDATPSLAEEAAAAAKAAAMAAADVARTSQDLLMTNSEEKRCLEELTSTLRAQANEMKSLRSAILKLEGGHNINGRIAVDDQDNKRISRTSSGQPYSNGKADFDSRSVRSTSPPASVEPSVAPHPKSYMEIMAMIQRGEKPSNIREINDAPPNPNQPLPNPRLAPKPKPWEVSQAPNKPLNTFPIRVNSNGTTHEPSNDQLNRDNTVPWWKPMDARISETDGGDDPKFVSPNMPLKKSWVPPQPAPVAMSETAAAIRQPKKSLSQTEQLSDDPRSGDISDELQKITKFSETGNGQNFAGSINEIMQEGNAAPYLEA